MRLRVCSETQLLLAFALLLVASSSPKPAWGAEFVCDNGVDDELSLLQTSPAMNWGPDRSSRSKKLLMEADELSAWQPQSLLVHDGALSAEAPKHQNAGLQRQVQQLGGAMNTGSVDHGDLQLGLSDTLSNEAARDSLAASEWVTLQRMMEDLRGRSTENEEASSRARQAQNELHKALEVAKRDKLEAERQAEQASYKADKLEAEKDKSMEALLEVKRVASAELREASIQLQQEHEDVQMIKAQLQQERRDADAKVKWATHARIQAAKQVNWATAAQKEATRAADAMEQVAEAQLRTQGLS